jgi:hypothetical protein
MPLASPTPVGPRALARLTSLFLGAAIEERTQRAATHMLQLAEAIDDAFGRW